MGIELELAVLYVLQTFGTATFGVFEVETPAWRKIVKWLLMAAITLGLYIVVGHWALLFPVTAATAGLLAHFRTCKRWGIHPIKATPRRAYYECRGWSWVE